MIENFKGRSIRIDNWLERQAKPFLSKMPNLENSEDLFIKIENIVHYLESASAPVNINRISFIVADQNAQKWMERLNAKKVSKVEDEDAVEAFFKDEDYLWVKLKTQESYAREGVKMGHCVSTYYRHEGVVIYSLRDSDNEPHCTIEVKGNKILQIKGRGNKTVVEKYHYLLRRFIKKLNIPIESFDAAKYGWILIKDENGNSSKAIAEEDLPEFVDAMWGHYKIILSQKAKIPQKMIVNNIKISNQKNLDLSKWEIKNQLELENCVDVVLPDNLNNINLTLNKVKFSSKYKNFLKETKVKLGSFTINKSEIECLELEIKAGFKVNNSKIKVGTLVSNTETNILDSVIIAEEAFIKKIDSENRVSIFALKNVKKITVDVLNLDDELTTIIDKIYLPESIIRIKTDKLTTWPSHWQSIYFIDMSLEQAEKINFQNLKNLNSMKISEYAFVSKKIGENIRKVLNDKNPSVLFSSRDDIIVKKGRI